VNAVIPPVAIDGPSITIRKFFKEKLTINQLIELGSITKKMAEFSRACVVSRLNIVISGGTGSGKTTTLNILSGFIPEDERIVTIEDAAELRLHQTHVLRLETKSPNIDGSGSVSIRDLVRNSLRMRPDRIVVGECRGGEALDMLQAMNTGHDGSLTTVHANSPRDALSRLETLSLMSGLDMPLHVIREQIASAIDVIVHQSRLKDGTRKITHITEVAGMEGNTIVMTDIFKFDQTGIDAKGKILGELKPTGIRPMFIERLEASGFKLGADVFSSQIAAAMDQRRQRDRRR
jgi:pilus assembly protein CpaF